MKNLKIIQIGCGKMSKYTMRYVYEKNGSICGAFDISSELIGKDIAEIIGTNSKGIIIDNINNLDEFLKENKVDIAIVTTMSLVNDVKDILKTCAQNGVNAITTCEEAFFCENSNPTIFNEIDKLAKENNCTITGCGYQDVFWGNLIYTIAGSTHKITKIKGSSSYNVEDYGLALAKAHGAGLSIEEFEKEIASTDNISSVEREKLINRGEFLPSYMWNTVGWIADRFNLTIQSMTQKCVPLTDDEDLHSDTLNMTIKKGKVTGMSAVVTATTEENIDIEAECIGKVYNKNEFDRNKWSIIGEPETTIVIDKPQTVELTCANIVNRITDVIKSDPGFIATSKMDVAKYIK